MAEFCGFEPSTKAMVQVDARVARVEPGILSNLASVLWAFSQKLKHYTKQQVIRAPTDSKTGQSLIDLLANGRKPLTRQGYFDFIYIYNVCCIAQIKRIELEHDKMCRVARKTRQSLAVFGTSMADFRHSVIVTFVALKS